MSRNIKQTDVKQATRFYVMRVLSVDETKAPYRVDIVPGYLTNYVHAWEIAARYRDLNPRYCYIAGEITGITPADEVENPADDPR